MAAPTFVDIGANAVAGASSTSVVLSFSGAAAIDIVGEATNDYALVALYKENNAAVSTPAGWTLLGQADQATGGFKYSAYVYGRRLDGTETTVTWSWTGACWRYLECAVYRNAVTTENPVITFVAEAETAQNTAPSHAAITVQRSNSALVWIVFNFSDISNTTPPSGYAYRTVAGQGARNILWYDDLTTTAGSSGAVAGTLGGDIEYPLTVLLELATEGCSVQDPYTTLEAYTYAEHEAGTYEALETSLCQTVLPGVIGTAAAAYAPTISLPTSLSLTPGVISSAVALYAPTLTRSVVPGVIGSVVQAYSPTVSIPIPVTLVPNTITSAEAVHAPSIASTAPITLSPGVIASAEQLYAPSLTRVVLPGVVASAAAVYAPTVAITAPGSVTPGVIASVAQVHAPTVTVSAAPLTISPDVIASAAQLFGPVLVTVAPLQTLTPATIPSAATAYAPDVAFTYPPIVVALEGIASDAQVYAPSVVKHARPPAPPLIVVVRGPAPPLVPALAGTAPALVSSTRSAAPVLVGAARSVAPPLVRSTRSDPPALVPI